jgi:hypothetical protein
MKNESLQRLLYLIEKLPNLLSQIPLAEFEKKPAPNVWSKKQILGHLIDSAANNHHRFIRAQYEPIPQIFYNQNKWNELNNYQHLPANHVIELWTMYNRHLVEVIRNIPEEQLLTTCRTGETEPVTLLFILQDYVQHLEHHLKQIIDL